MESILQTIAETHEEGDSKPLWGGAIMEEQIDITELIEVEMV